MNSNWSYSPEMHKLGQNIFWPLFPLIFDLTLTLCLNITFVNGTMIQQSERHFEKGVMDRQMDRWTDRQTKRTVHRSAWSQLKTHPPTRWAISLGDLQNKNNILPTEQVTTSLFYDNSMFHNNLLLVLGQIIWRLTYKLLENSGYVRNI